MRAARTWRKSLLSHRRMRRKLWPAAVRLGLMRSARPRKDRIPEHPAVATSLKNYAALLRKTGHGDLATMMELRAKAIRAKHARDNPIK